MKESLNWQKKAIFIFAGIIIILSIILTTFAIREAQREKIFREREIVGDQQKAAEFIIGQVNAIISETEIKIDKMLSVERVQTQEIGLTEVCSRIMNEEEIVDEIFLINQEGEVVFPHMKPLFFLTGGEENFEKTSFTLEFNEVFKSAEAAEFKTKDYSLAIRTYQNLINRTSDKANHATLLNCIGRCYTKSEEPSRAVKAYQQILKQYPSERSLEGTPLGIIAQYQLGKIYCDIHEKDKGIQALFELYSGLLESRWLLSKTQFHFYRNQVKTVIETYLTDIDDLEHKRILIKKWDDLKQLEEERLRRASARESLIQKIIPILKAKKPSSGETDRKFHHLSQGVEEGTCLFSSITINEHSILGLRLDSEALIEKLLPLKLERLPMRKDWHIQIRDELGSVLVGRNMTQLKDPIPQIAFSIGFEDDFPPWKINIYQSDPDRVERQFNRKRNIYILFAVVIVAALFFGGFFWIKSTGKELELAKLKSDFVSTVSHEFMTPLTSIRYLAELLQRGRVKEEEQKHQYYQTITDESERLSRLIENILDFSKIEAGMKEYQLEETDLVSLVRDVASRFQKQVAGKTFRLKTDIANQIPRLSADKDAISRALFNLLDNALKYSGENPEITLRTWPDEESIFLEVQDNGIGISKEEQRSVFEKFYRSRGVHESKIKGSGIGLTIVDHIVESHGGEVFLESDLGKGTHVTMKFPVKQKK